MNDSPTIRNPDASSEIPPAMVLLGGLLGLVQVLSLFAIVLPTLVTAVIHELSGKATLPPGPIRSLGFGLLAAATVVRFLLPKGPKHDPSERAFTALAEATGGAYTVEPRQIGRMGWSGGPTVRWTVEGVPVMLETTSLSRNSSTTKISAIAKTAKPLRFNVLPRNFLTRMMTSPQFVTVVKVSVTTTREVSAGEKPAPEPRAQAASEIGVLAGSEVSLGITPLDEKVIVKSNDPDLTRYVLTDGGVVERMGDLIQRRKSWTLSVVTDEGGHGALIALDLTGPEREAAVLTAMWALMEALLRSLGRNGVLAARDPRVVRTTISRQAIG